MRIGIDAHILGKGAGGVERFLAYLVRLLPAAMADHQIVVFVDQLSIRRVILPEFPNLEIVPMRVSNPLIGRSVLLPWLVRRHHLDILMVQRLTPSFCGTCQLVLVLHDITPIKYPQAYRGLTNILIRFLTANSVRRAQLIFTPTKVIANEVAQYFGKTLNKVVPFYNGVDTDVFRPAQKLPDQQPYIFTSGAIESRKNLETLLHARAQLGPNFPWTVRIAGGVRDTHYQKGLEALVAELGLVDQVSWLGFVDENQLVKLYQEATVFVTASRDEGFNIPPLEAMACGTPVVCSDIPVHLELFHGAAFFFSTESSEDLAAFLRRFHADTSMSESLRSQARDCVARLSWPAMAQRIAQALQSFVRREVSVSDDT